MFKKKPVIKNLSSLRSSDRRKVADQIISHFQVEVPQAVQSQDGEEPAQTLPDGAPTLASIRNSLLPENIQSARFTTTYGPQLKEVSGTVYVGAHEGGDERILWIKIWDRLYPTVYTLWHNPGLVPLLHTPTFVMQKLQGGADLMIPGLARGPPFPSRATKDSIVAVAKLDSPSVPLFVGVCEIDVASLEQVIGAKGHAVRGMHWEGDEIWSWSSTSKPGLPPPAYLDGWDDNMTDIQDGVGNLDLNEADCEDEGGVALSQVSPNPAEDAQNNTQLEGNNAEPSTAEIDAAFRNAFLYAMYDAKIKEPQSSTHGVTLPILPTLLISHYVQPYLPIQSPQQTTFYNIKKTSWKNVKKFIKYLDKEQIVKAKDRNGGETVILDVDFDDQSITSFTPYRLPKKDTATLDGGGGGGAKPSADADPSINQTLSMQLLYRPSQRLSTIFPPSSSNSPHGSNLFTSSSLKRTLEDYLTSNSLISPSNHRQVVLDQVLSNAVFSLSNADDKAILAANLIPRDTLFNRIINDTHLCAPYHVLLTQSQDPSSVKASAGAPPKIHITLETRSGNKTVTKISGVEKFNINPNLLADELQKKCASSVSVTALVGAAAKGGKVPQEILVQGSQKNAVEDALEKRGVKQAKKGTSNWIEIMDKTKGKGKGRR